MPRGELRLIWLLVLISVCVTTAALAKDASLSDHSRGRRVIVLDPGHGGHDLGAVGPSGLAEKSVTLALAKKLKDALAGTYAVHLTRDGDYWLNIEKRTAMANHHSADIFISLHAGGSFHHKARGMAIFYFGPSTSQGLAPQKERLAVQDGEHPTPWNHIQSMYAKKSQVLANLVHRELVARLNPMNRGIHKAPCSVLRGADMPAILVEIGYLSHPAEEKELKDFGILSAAAVAMGQGIREFFRQTSSCTNGKGMIEEEIITGRGAAW